MLRGPMLDEGEQGRADAYAGLKLGELILHELGHGMEANHGQGLMDPSPELSVNYDAPSPALHFTTKSKGEILKTLERLAGAGK
jgi:hypothetical protein